MRTATTYVENLRKWRSGEAMREHTAEVTEKSRIDRVADAIIREAVATKGRAEAAAVTKRETSPALESLETRVTKRAAELRAGDPTLSTAEAITKVYEESPALYQEECAATDCLPAGYGSGPTDEEYETALFKSVETPESAKVKRQLDDLIEAELRRLTAERARATGGKSAPISTREEALVRILATTEGRRLRDAWLKAIASERAAAAA